MSDSEQGNGLRRRDFLLKIGTGAVSTAVSFAVAETIARKGFDTSFLPYLGFDNTDVSRSIDEKILAIKDPSEAIRAIHDQLTRRTYPIQYLRYNSSMRFFECTPGFNWDIDLEENRVHRISNLGFRIPRDRDFDSFESNGLMAGGCSWTYGSGAPAERTFSNVAASELGMDAYNFGVASYSYVGALHQLEYLISNGTVEKLRPKHYTNREYWSSFTLYII